MKKLLLATIISASFWCVDAMNPNEEIRLLKQQLAQKDGQIAKLTEKNSQLRRQQGSSMTPTLSITNSMTSFVSSTTPRLNRTSSTTAHSTAKCIISRPKKRGFFANYVKSGLEKSYMKKLISNLVYNLF